MNRISTGLCAVVIALSGLAAGPALAAPHGGGGGGGHAGGFGGHAFGGGHAAGPAVGGYAGHGYGGHFAAVGGYHGYAGYAHGYGNPQSYGYAHGYGYGYGYRGGFHPWGGGYWGGAYWPRAYFGLGFAWFLPALPLYYSTYWYGGVPYYYADDAYYTWSPGQGGYVATTPPPQAGGEPAAAPPDAGATAGAGPGADRVFAYPKNNQTDEQQSTDRRECEQWAAGQASASNAADYRRALVVCFEGRGYSAQ
jgi:hypothetical protein